MLLVLLLACGEGKTRCSDACDKLYASDRCDLQRPGQSSEELIEACFSICLEGWRAGYTGEDFSAETWNQDPAERDSLESREEVEVWLEQVEGDSEDCAAAASSLYPVW